MIQRIDRDFKIDVLSVPGLLSILTSELLCIECYGYERLLGTLKRKLTAVRIFVVTKRYNHSALFPFDEMSSTLMQYEASRACVFQNCFIYTVD